MAIKSLTDKLTKFCAAGSTSDTTGLSYSFQGHALGQTGITSDNRTERTADHGGAGVDFKPVR